MATIAVWLKIDEEHVVQALHEAGDKLEGIEGEVALDFSSVRRMDSSALAALGEFADLAERKKVSVALRGVDFGIYKVLKLVKLASRFKFAS